MRLPTVLVSATRFDQSGALLRVDLEQEISEVIVPYRIGGLVADDSRIYLLHLDDALTQARLEIFDDGGLVAARRVANCGDAHCLAMAPDGGLAVTATANNEVVFLDREGLERDRWTPDPRAEPDAWHLNSLHAGAGRLVATCFGPFHCFRDWAGAPAGSGLLLEVPSGRILARGLKNPHNPWRIDGGWIINDSGRHRTVFCSDAGDLEPIVEFSLFTRGLVVTPELVVVGLSADRAAAEGERCARIAVVERASRRTIKQIRLPFAEVGHLLLAPEDSRVEALRRTRGLEALHQSRPLTARDQRGSIEVLDAEPPIGTRKLRVVLRIRNESSATWLGAGASPLAIGCEILGDDDEPLFRRAERTPLPVPLAPGRCLTMPLVLDWPLPRQRGAWRQLRFTLVEGATERWRGGERWSPGTLDLARLGEVTAGPTGSLAALARTEQELAAAEEALESLRAEHVRTVESLELRAALAAELGVRALTIARRVSRIVRGFPRLGALARWLIDRLHPARKKIDAVAPPTVDLRKSVKEESGVLCSGGVPLR